MKFLLETESLAIHTNIMSETSEILDEKIVANGTPAVININNCVHTDKENNLSNTNIKSDCCENKENIKDSVFEKELENATEESVGKRENGSDVHESENSEENKTDELTTNPCEKSAIIEEELLELTKELCDNNSNGTVKNQENIIEEDTSLTLTENLVPNETLTESVGQSSASKEVIECKDAAFKGENIEEKTVQFNNKSCENPATVEEGLQELRKELCINNSINSVKSEENIIEEDKCLSLSENLVTNVISNGSMEETSASKEVTECKDAAYNSENIEICVKDEGTAVRNPDVVEKTSEDIKTVSNLKELEEAISDQKKDSVELKSNEIKQVSDSNDHACDEDEPIAVQNEDTSVEKEFQETKTDPNFEESTCGKDVDIVVQEDTAKQICEKINTVPDSKETNEINQLNIESKDDITSMEEGSKKDENSIVNLEESSSSNDFEEELSNQKTNTKEIDKLKNSQDTVILNDSEMDVDEIIEGELTKDDTTKNKSSAKDLDSNYHKPSVLKLSNTLDILSDDEDVPPKNETAAEVIPENIDDKQCINIEDDDDIMLIDDDTCPEEKSDETIAKDINFPNEIEIVKIPVEDKVSVNNVSEKAEIGQIARENIPDTEIDQKENQADGLVTEKADKNTHVDDKQTTMPYKPLVQENFLQTCKKNLAEMTRDDLEELCILKIVESIVDRSNLSDIKTKLKTMAQTIEDFKKKFLMLTKQNRDLQVVLKSVQEEQKKMTDLPITPLKITRSVGMQVLMSDTPPVRKKTTANNTANGNKTAKNNASNQQNKIKQNQNSPQIPVPRLVPATPAAKTPPSSQTNTPMKVNTPLPNGVRNSQAQKSAEKRTITRMQSMTVDLTDDEPPAKAARISTPVRLVAQQNLMANPRAQFQQNANNLRKVYIPISGAQTSNVRAPSPAIKSPPMRPRSSVIRLPQNSIVRGNAARHPAPLPETVKQYQRPNWKALPPAPDLKLSKVENGIVISWKIEGYQEDSYEEIASYQLYAYQETHLAPSTSLWKKIGDVKALPLPMACTLTQFMAGFKYFFAVRAVDVRSRLGPFSLPGSILLLNKV